MAAVFVIIGGNGTVTSSNPVPVGAGPTINCSTGPSGNCSYIWHGTDFVSIDLLATPDPGWYFDGWSPQYQNNPPSPYACPCDQTNDPNLSNPSITVLGCSNGYCSEQTWTAVFQQCPVISVSPGTFNFTVGVNPNINLAPITYGGSGNYTYTELGYCGDPCCSSLSSINLSLNPSGLISGLPTIPPCPNYECSILIGIVDNVTGCSDQVCIRLKTCPPLSITNPSSDFNYSIGSPFSMQLTATGGSGSYSFATIGPGQTNPCDDVLCAGLPPGLTFHAPGGLIDGTPLSAACTAWYYPIVITDLQTDCVTIVCVAFYRSCYKLFNCAGRSIPIIVTNNLSQYLGSVIQILGECFAVEVSDTCDGAITLNNPIITVFESCCECNPPKLYHLTDCTLQTPQISTTSDLSQYVGQVIKVCDFQSTLTVLTPTPIQLNCQGGETLGFVTQVTGSTSGFFYEESSGLILSYTNPSAFPLVVGSSLCFQTSFSGIYTVTGIGADPINTIQFFLGTTAITAIIPFSIKMSTGFLQYLITLNSLDPTITITVVSFTSSGLVVQISTTNPTTATETSAVINPPYTNTGIFIAPVTGNCICYTVTNPGTSCDEYPLFMGVISGCFPDCECCLGPEPEEPKPLYIPTPPEIDKHTYRIPESECDIEANKKFANAMYDKFKTEAYGMENCCPRDFNKIWIEKELSDLSKIKC